jgi:hypothetical protein
VRTRLDGALSPPETKIGRIQRCLLALLAEHERDNALPTSGRFLFYEMEQRGMARKPAPDDARANKRRQLGWPPGEQDITDALTKLRECGSVPWNWIEDVTRRVAIWAYAATVAAYMRDRLAEATINPWGGARPPLILCESRGTAGVLERTVSAYCCPIAGTSGQVNGFLRTVIAPLLEDGDRAVLYLGDLDLTGVDIEGNTRSVLERCLGRPLDWRRLGITAEQAGARGLEPIRKQAGRKPAHLALEVEALGQATAVGLVRETLEAMLPEPLTNVLEREQAEREALRAILKEDG